MRVSSYTEIIVDEMKSDCVSAAGCSSWRRASVKVVFDLSINTERKHSSTLLSKAWRQTDARWERVTSVATVWKMKKKSQFLVVLLSCSVKVHSFDSSLQLMFFPPVFFHKHMSNLFKYIDVKIDDFIFGVRHEKQKAMSYGHIS